jgi:hypothetical protein
VTPLVLTTLLLTPADPPPSTDPKPVAATREEQKELLEGYKKARPRLPMPPAEEGARGVNNGRFRQYYLPEFGSGGAGFGRDPDPAMTLDNTFKVKLFWVTSRANNCYY